jgi:hypothetical protein
MSSTYRGIYRLGPADNPSDIQVVDPGGNSISLPIDLYESRGLLPLWCVLPTKRQYTSLLAIQNAEQGSSPFINIGDAEECVDRGWLEPLATNVWRLTDQGKKLL